MKRSRIREIIKGLHGITADTASRFSKFFKTSPEFWMNLQGENNLRKARIEKKEVLDKIEPLVV